MANQPTAPGLGLTISPGSPQAEGIPYNVMDPTLSHTNVINPQSPIAGTSDFLNQLGDNLYHTLTSPVRLYDNLKEGVSHIGTGDYGISLDTLAIVGQQAFTIPSKYFIEGKRDEEMKAYVSGLTNPALSADLEKIRDVGLWAGGTGVEALATYDLLGLGQIGTGLLKEGGETFLRGGLGEVGENGLNKGMMPDVGGGHWWNRLDGKGLPDYRLKDYVEDPQKFAEIADIANQTVEGQRVLSTVEGLEGSITNPDLKLDMVFDKSMKFTDEVKDYAGYFKEDHILGLNPVYQDLPSELGTPAFIHECTHRTCRWEKSVLQHEIDAYTTEGKVWQEMKNNPEMMKNLDEQLQNLPPEQKEVAEVLMNSYDETAEMTTNKPREEIVKWLEDKGYTLSDEETRLWYEVPENATEWDKMVAEIYKKKRHQKGD